MKEKFLRAGEDYLEAILQLEKENGSAGVRTTDIARRLEVTKPSVNRAMKALHEAGYIEQESYGEIFLTDSGRDKASKVQQRHDILNRFFRDVLHVSKEQSAKDACLIEHYISHESIEKLKEFLDGELI